jgi:hypothetical protein
MNKITKIKESDLQPKIKKKILQRLQHLWAYIFLIKLIKKSVELYYDYLLRIK